jgi:voltage-gated potassium channel
MAHGMLDEPRVAAWNRWLDWPLTVLAAGFLALYAWSVLDRTIPAAGRDLLEAAFTATWVLFGADYLVRVALARRRWRYVGRHLVDLVLLLLPMFRPLRALRLVMVVSVLNRQLRDDLRGRVVVSVVGAVTLAGFVAALAVLDAERDAPGATITTFGDALWWAVTTISTVGYGDLYPVTEEGRIVAAVLMIAGIALLGVITATIASWFVEAVRTAGEQAEEGVAEELSRAERQLAEVLAQLGEVSQRLDRLERETVGAGPHNGAPRRSR